MVSLLYAGVPRFALALLEAGHTLAAVVLPWLDEDEETWMVVQACVEQGIPLFPAAALTNDATPDERAALEALPAPELLLVMGFERKIPAWALGLGKRGAWNVHPSLLPRHRGYNPYYWTVRKADAVGGVTIHAMTSEYDAGDILAQQDVPLGPGETSGRLWERLLDLSGTLVLEVLQRVDDGAWPTPRAQDVRLATHAPKPTEQELSLDLHSPAEDVVRHVRAATPEPGARVTLAGIPCVVRGAAPGPTPPPGTAPGKVFVVDGLAYVAAGEGSVRLFNVEREAMALDLRALAGEP